MLCGVSFTLAIATVVKNKCAQAKAVKDLDFVQAVRDIAAIPVTEEKNTPGISSRNKPGRESYAIFCFQKYSLIMKPDMIRSCFYCPVRKVDEFRLEEEEKGSKKDIDKEDKENN